MAKKPYKDADTLKVSANITIDPSLKKIAHERFSYYGFRSFSELVAASLTKFLES